ncbi:MAG: hypothetical protein Q7S34_02225 [bacterium]|nr:hypothetical protein [bacterium]
MRKNNNRGFEIGTLIFWLAIIFFLVAATVYKYAEPKVKNAPKDRTPDIEAPIQPRVF